MMISPGSRSGTLPLCAVGRVMETSFSHWEKTEVVTKKQSSRKTMSIIAVIWKVGSAPFVFFRKFMLALPL